MDDTTLGEIREALERERQRLLDEIAEFEQARQDNLSESSGEHNYRDHMADQGSARFAREIDLTLEDEARQHLAQVERALRRLAEGTYGICTKCGDAIPDSRLEAMPEAELCVPCKEREETR